MTRKNGSNTEGRNPDGTFTSGNPGRPKGARHKVTRAVEALLDGQAEALTSKAIEQALAGDGTALRLCLERIAPARKDTPVSFDMPEVTDALSAGEAAKAVVNAVASGELSPSEGGAVMAVVEQFRRTLELTEIEARLTALEERKGEPA